MDKIKIYEPIGGDDFGEISENAYTHTLRTGEMATFKFNGVRIIMVDESVWRPPKDNNAEQAEKTIEK